MWKLLEEWNSKVSITLWKIFQGEIHPSAGTERYSSNVVTDNYNWNSLLWVLIILWNLNLLVWSDYAFLRAAAMLKVIPIKCSYIFYKFPFIMSFYQIAHIKITFHNKFQETEPQSIVIRFEANRWCIIHSLPVINGLERVTSSVYLAVLKLGLLERE